MKHRGQIVLHEREKEKKKTSQSPGFVKTALNIRGNSNKICDKIELTET